MSALLKIKDEDNERIEKLRQELGKDTKVDVVREALMLLEEKILREKKIVRYRRAAKLSAQDYEAQEILNDFMEAYEGPDED
jgi:Arc/MetJ-type ribon-helix-helix transcriptional regulator